MNRLAPTVIIGASIAGMIVVGAAFIRDTPVLEPGHPQPVATSAGSGATVAVAANDIPPMAAASPDDHDRRRILTPGIDEEAGHDLLVRLVAEARPGLVSDLVTITSDLRHAPGWRNYAIQHLATHHELHRDAASLEHLRRVALVGDHTIRPVDLFAMVTEVQR